MLLGKLVQIVCRGSRDSSLLVQAAVFELGDLRIRGELERIYVCEDDCGWQIGSRDDI